MVIRIVRAMKYWLIRWWQLCRYHREYYFERRFPDLDISSVYYCVDSRLCDVFDEQKYAEMYYKEGSYELSYDHLCKLDELVVALSNKYNIHSNDIREVK